jgi:uncharacterized DUF497 family protein
VNRVPERKPYRCFVFQQINRCSLQAVHEPLVQKKNLDFPSVVYTITAMEIEFDPAKDAENLRKHGVSLAAAANLAWDESMAWPDERFGYDEWRLSALVPGGDCLYFVSYVERGEKFRVISLRAANRKEVNDYARNH